MLLLGWSRSARLICDASVTTASRSTHVQHVAFFVPKLTRVLALTLARIIPTDLGDSVVRSRFRTVMDPSPDQLAPGLQRLAVQRIELSDQSAFTSGTSTGSNAATAVRAAAKSLLGSTITLFFIAAKSPT